MRNTKRSSQFGVWFLTTKTLDIELVYGKDRATSRACVTVMDWEMPVGTLLKCPSSAHTTIPHRGSGFFHTKEGYPGKLSYGSKLINYTTAIPLDHPQYFVNNPKPTQDVVDMWCMLYNLDREFIMKLLSTT